MGRNISPIVRRELANLDKDAESRKMAIKALKTYVKDLDSKAIPQFLAQVSESKTPTFSSGEHTISLYEVLARVHGPNIVPQIENIMSTIIKTLTSSAGSFPLQQACSKVVPAIARYGIEPTTPDDKKRFIIHSLCKPLLDSLLGTQESLAFGAALCLKSLVDSDNWRFASDEIVNEVCLRVAGALEENPTQTNSHMGLVMALAKRNSFTVEAYARSLIRSGLRILDCGAVEGNSQKKLSAIQMVNFLMKCVDPRSIFSELQNVMEVLEKCHTDKMPFVRGAAFEALQTARTLASEKGSVTGSNFSRRDRSRRKDFPDGRERYSLSASPESQTMDSFSEYGSLVDSPTSTGQVSCNFEYGGRPVNRKLWRSEDNGGVDVSLKDGLYSEAGSGSNGSRQYFEGFEEGEVSDFRRENSEVFSGFGHATSRDEGSLSTTPSPQRAHCQLNYDAIKIYTTPRKLLRSLQNSNDDNSDFSENSATRIRSQVSNRLEWSPARKLDLDGNVFSDNLKRGLNDNDQADELRGQETNDSDSESESVSSTGNVAPMAGAEVSNVVSQENNCKIQNPSMQKTSLGQTVRTCIRGVFFGIFFILVAAILLAMLIDNQEKSFHPVPT